MPSGAILAVRTSFGLIARTRTSQLASVAHTAERTFAKLLEFSRSHIPVRHQHSPHDRVLGLKLGQRHFQDRCIPAVRFNSSSFWKPACAMESKISLTISR